MSLFFLSREYEAAMTVIDGGLTECSKFYEPLLQVIKARLMAASGSLADGIIFLSNACSHFRVKQPTENECLNWIEIEREQRAMLLRELVQLYLAQERNEDAEYSVTELEQLMPNTPETLTIKGDVFHAQGRVYQAIQQYELALSIDPNHEAATCSLGDFREASFVKTWCPS